MPYIGPDSSPTFDTNISITGLTATGNAVVGGTLGVTGAATIDNQLDIEEVHEKVTVITSTSGTLTFDTAAQGVVLGTANQSANRTINFSNVNSTLSTGQSVTCAVLLTQGSTAYYLKLTVLLSHQNGKGGLRHLLVMQVVLMFTVLQLLKLQMLLLLF